MGTFHSDKGALHGITVVVDTVGPKVYIGRCWEIDERQIVLVDVDEHNDGEDGRSKDDFIRQAAKVGVWKKHERIALLRSQVGTITPLGAVSTGTD